MMRNIGNEGTGMLCIDCAPVDQEEESNTRETAGDCDIQKEKNVEISTLTRELD